VKYWLQRVTVGTAAIDCITQPNLYASSMFHQDVELVILTMICGSDSHV